MPSHRNWCHHILAPNHILKTLSDSAGQAAHAAECVTADMTQLKDYFLSEEHTLETLNNGPIIFPF